MSSHIKNKVRNTPSNPIPIPLPNNERKYIPTKKLFNTNDRFVSCEPVVSHQPSQNNVLLRLDTQKKPSPSEVESEIVRNDINDYEYPNPPQELLNQFAKYPIIETTDWEEADGQFFEAGRQPDSKKQADPSEEIIFPSSTANTLPLNYQVNCIFSASKIETLPLPLRYNMAELKLLDK